MRKPRNASSPSQPRKYGTGGCKTRKRGDRVETIAYVYSPKRAYRIEGTGPTEPEAFARAHENATLYELLLDQGIEPKEARARIQRVRRGRLKGAAQEDLLRALLQAQPVIEARKDVVVVVGAEAHAQGTGEPDTPPRDATLREFVVFFLQRAVDNAKHENERRNERFGRMVCEHVPSTGGPPLGVRVASTLKPHHFRDLILTWKRRRPQAKQDEGDNYLADFKNYVGRVCEWLHVYEFVARDYGSTLPRVSRPSKRPLGVQTADVVTLFRAAEDPRLECFLVLAYMSGCVKEVLGLTTAMIEGNHVHLRAQLGRKANPDFDPSRLPDPRTNPKSVSALLPWLKRSSRQRTLVLNDELMRIVMRSIDLAKETEIPTEVGSIRATPVVPNQQGRFWQVQDFRLAWNAMCTRAGVRITPHQFRALLTREERKRGVAFDQIAAWLGHSGPDTTIRSYHRYEEGEIPMLDPMVERANRLSNELTKGS